MNEIKVNLENLSEDERTQLMNLIGKANNPVSKVWKPKKGETYYSISGYGEVGSCSWNDEDFDKGGYSIGNCFKTRKEVQAKIEYLKIQKELQDFADENNDYKIDWRNENQLKWNMLCNYEHTTEQIICAARVLMQGQDICFTSEKLVKQAVDKIGEERLKKYYFGVE